MDGREPGMAAQPRRRCLPGKNHRAVQRQEELEAFAWPTSSPRSSGSRPTRSAASATSEAVEAGDAEKATELQRAAARALDKAASKGVIHKNQAANRKSAMAKRTTAA
jgi:ribosomal protein S20